MKKLRNRPLEGPQEEVGRNRNDRTRCLRRTARSRAPARLGGLADTAPSEARGIKTHIGNHFKGNPHRGLAERRRSLAEARRVAYHADTHHAAL